MSRSESVRIGQTDTGTCGMAWSVICRRSVVVPSLYRCIVPWGFFFGFVGERWVGKGVDWAPNSTTKAVVRILFLWIGNTRRAGLIEGRKIGPFGSQLSEYACYLVSSSTRLDSDLCFGRAGEMTVRRPIGEGDWR